MSERKRKGVRIGAYISGMIGNLNHNEIDHILTEVYHAKLHRNCDDMVMLGRSKREIRFLLNTYDRLAAERGLVVKANSFYVPIRQNGKKKKRRWRQRGKRKGNRLSGLRIQSGQYEASEKHQEKVCGWNGPGQVKETKEGNRR